MKKSRLEAFSDGVIAILITIMILELRPPEQATWKALAPVLPQVLIYLLSFIYLAIYWNNHHHLLHAVERINGASLWANLHLLFWLSLVPFATAWMGRGHFAPVPTAVYGILLFMAAIAYYIFQRTLMVANGPDARLRLLLGKDLKGRSSPLIYLAAIALAFVVPLASDSLYLLVALIWLVPDRRIERAIDEVPPEAGASNE